MCNKILLREMARHSFGTNN